MGSPSHVTFSNLDKKELIKGAKVKLKSGAESRHVFISFDSEDEDKVNLLRGQAKNLYTDLSFDDYSLKKEIKSHDDDYIKRRIRERIERASVNLVYLSDKTFKSKWVKWEIEESLNRKKGVVGFYDGDTPPKELPEAFKKHNLKIVKWGHKELMGTMEEAVSKRKI